VLPMETIGDLLNIGDDEEEDDTAKSKLQLQNYKSVLQNIQPI